MDVWREDLVGDGIVHLTFGILDSQLCSQSEAVLGLELTLKKLSLISWLVSSDLPVTGSSRSVYLVSRYHPPRAGLLVLNFRMYGTMLSRSNTSALDGSSSSVSANTATGFLKG